MSLNFFKRLIFLIIFLHDLLIYMGYEYTHVPISNIENSLRTEPKNFKKILIDNSGNVAYLTHKNKNNVVTNFAVTIPDNENYKETIQNLVGDYYYEMEIEFKDTSSFFGFLFGVFKKFAGFQILFTLIDHIKKFFDFKKEYDKIIDKNVPKLDKINFDFTSNIITTAPEFYDIKYNIKTRFRDVIGQHTVKSDLGEFIKYLKHSDTYEKNGCTLSKGILFTGLPGTGKTLMAKAFAGECGINYISTSGSSFDEIYVGVGAKRVRELFDKARKIRPCVIFIDEIDALGSRRDKNLTGTNQTMNAFLSELDGMNDNTGIILIAATNLAKNLDKALLRSGRIDKKIHFDVPNIKERKKLFKLYLSKISLDKSFDYANDVKILSKKTAGLTGADIRNVCNQAITNYMKNFRLKRMNKKKKSEDKIKDNKNIEKIIINEPNYDLTNNDIRYLNQDQSLNFYDSKDCVLVNPNLEKTGCNLKDLIEAIDDIVIGISKPERLLTDKERKVVAYHESGHTIIHCLLKHGTIPLKVSIIPRGEAALGYTQSSPQDVKLLFKGNIINQICSLLGGRAAEKVIFNDITTGASDDLSKLTALVHSYVTEYCMVDNYLWITDDDLKSDKYKFLINDKVTQIINYYYKYTCEVLEDEKYKNILHRLANELLEKEVINDNDIMNIIGNDNLFVLSPEDKF